MVIISKFKVERPVVIASLPLTKWSVLEETRYLEFNLQHGERKRGDFDASRGHPWFLLRGFG
jgi:hypothetical protein